MRIDHRSLKNEAKELMRTSKPSVIAVGALFLIASVIFQMLSTRLMGLNISNAEAMSYMNHAMEGNYEYALSLIERMQPPAGAYFIDLLIQAVKVILSAGFIIFLLNTIRKEEPCVGNLLDGFAFLPRILWLHILMGFKVILWSLLLFVPGIIAAFRYSQALYILIDDPSKKASQCIKESCEIMKGRKWDYFGLMLSFLGWYILGGMPYFGYMVQVWTTPYIALVYALYYLRLVKSQSYDPPEFDYQF